LNAVFRALGKPSSNTRLILEVRDKNTVWAGADHLTALGLTQ
jgi:hypothetical protein